MERAKSSPAPVMAIESFFIVSSLNIVMVALGAQWNPERVSCQRLSHPTKVYWSA
jgi:hypothetical protein